MSAPYEERWEQRLQAWAEYLDQKERGGKVKISSAYSLVGKGAPGEGDGIPLHVGDALDTNDLVIKLQDSLRNAVRVWYCETGTASQKAVRLDIHRDTLAARVSAAKRCLDDMHMRRIHEQSRMMAMTAKRGAR